MSIDSIEQDFVLYLFFIRRKQLYLICSDMNMKMRQVYLRENCKPRDESNPDCNECRRAFALILCK